MWDKTEEKFVPIELKDIPSAKGPVFRVGEEVTIHGLTFVISSIKRKRLILKVKT